MRAFLQSFVYAFEGIAYVLRTQRNARIHLIAGALAIAAGFYFRITAIEWAVLILAVCLVFTVEIINTVAELAVDLLTRRHDPMAKAAKDAGAGAVLVAALATLGVALALFGPRIWRLIAP